LVNKD